MDSPDQDLRKRTGIYMIVNLLNRKCYVGSASRDFWRRKTQHTNLLKNGKHPTRHLQAAFKHYSDSCFEFRVLEDCIPEKCLEREQHWIDLLQPEYNGHFNAMHWLGRKHSDETKAKISAANKGTKRTEAQKLAQGERMKGRVVSEETKIKMRKNHPRLPMPPEHKEKLRKLLTGRKQSPEGIAKRVAKTKGQKRTQEFCDNVSKRTKGRKVPWIEGIPMREEVKKKIGDANRGHRHTEESKKLMSDKIKAAWARRKSKP